MIKTKGKKKEELSINYDDNEIRHLPPRIACRLRPSMFIGSTGGAYGANNIYTEIIENAEDTIAEGHGDTLMTSTNLNGFIFVSDNGSGLPITMSLDRPDITSAELSISEFNSGNKFGESKSLGRIGMNGIGSSACNFLSAQYIVLSKITEANYNKSIPDVKKCWESAGPRSKRDLFYILVMEEGEKVYEGAGKLKDLEKQIFRGVKGYIPLPEGQSTMVLFKPDPKIFEDPRAEVPVTHLQYFLLIQEKFYKRNVNVIIDGVSLRSTFNPFKFEILRTIVPADTSANKQLGYYVTFEVDNSLSKSTSFGSVNGLCCNEGIHINVFKSLFKSTLRDTFKIRHSLLDNGLKCLVVLLGSELQYNSQTKEVLKQIVKVKPSDFDIIAKDIEKIFRKNPEYWGPYVSALDQLAESMKSLGAADKAQKMMDATSGVSSYRAKANFPKGFADATSKDRSQCELFLCFTGDTEILTCNEEKIRFTDLVERLNSGEKIYTFSITPEGLIKPAKIIAARKIKENADNLVRVNLDNGESFTCTSDHLIMRRDGTYEKAGRLSPGDSMMPIYIKTVNENGFDRRVVRSLKTTNYGRMQKEFSKTEGDYFVYRIMSNHEDTETHDSVNYESKKYIVRHHKDGNSLNDYPSNLMWCSNNWHRAHHGAVMLYEHSKKDQDLYNKVYVNSKQTEKFKIEHSNRILDFYKTERGEKTRDHLRKKAIEEWNNEELRKWRSEETKKYAREHPEWVKENKDKCLEGIYKDYLKPEVVKFLGKNPETSSEWNLAVFRLYYKTRYTRKKAIKVKYYDSLSHIELVKSELKKVENDDPLYLHSEFILKQLVDRKTEITYKSFNELVKEDLKIEGTLEQGIGYVSRKRRFLELFEKYESLVNTNHKVVSVEFLSNKQDVYCLEVDTLEHNFPLACGIFVKNCEGLSAAGSLIAGRKDTKYHSVIALRGKILNVTDKSVDRALESKVISDIFNVIGLGLDVNWVGKDARSFEEAHEMIMRKSRYSKIIIATDADPDGSAIFNEIVYLFSKFARFLLDHHMVYRAMSPLFRGYSKKTGKITYYYPDDPFDPRTSIPLDLDTKKHYDRWKGLSSLTPETGEVFDSFYNPTTRRLILVTPEGIDYSMDLNENINSRKKLLYDKGILSNPYNFKDI